MTASAAKTGSLAARVILGAVLLGAASWLVISSPLFSVREVRVVGSDRLEQPEILRVAAVEEGANLVTLPIEDVERRLQDHPWISRAVVERDLPAAVVIHIVERRPAGWVQDPDGPVVVAGDGTVLSRERRRPSSLPEIARWPDPLTVGETVRGLHLQLRISSTMSPWLLRRVESAAIDDGDAILQLREGGLVLFGTPTDITAKNRALAEMLRWAEGEAIAVRTIDVRVASAPSLEPVRGARIAGDIPTP